MTTTALSIVVVAVSLVLGVVVWLVREQRIDPRYIPLLATACAVGLGFMLLTDWPTDLLNNFWADHSVLAAAASSVLLVGIGYLIYEQEDQKRQGRLAAGLSGAGLGGIVDHVIDVEIALALVSATEPPTYVGWDEPAKPLRWVRELRPVLGRTPGTGRATAGDPRSRPVWLPPTYDPAWRLQLVDQSIRRVLAAMRDWSPLISGSDDGVTALIILSEIRKDLMELTGRLNHRQDDVAIKILTILRQRLRIIAYFFEDLARNATGTDESINDTTPLRDEILLCLQPLPPRGPSFKWEADEETVPDFSRKWRHRLETVCRTLEAPVDVEQIRDYVKWRHQGQMTKQGADYYTAHLDPVAQRLTQHGEHAVMAGLLHDVLEDTPATTEELHLNGVPEDVVRAVVAVSKRPGEPYDDLIRRAAADPLGRVVKLADNAQNLADNDALAAIDPDTATRLLAKYTNARRLLERPFV